MSLHADPPRPEHAPTARRRRRALALALAYALAGAVWILVTDALFEQLFRDASLLARMSAIKGWLFVGATAALIFVLVLRLDAPAAQGGSSTRRLAAAEHATPTAADGRVRLTTGETRVLGLAVVIVVLATGALLSAQRDRAWERAAEQAEAVAQRRSVELRTGLDQRLAEIRVAASLGDWGADGAPHGEAHRRRLQTLREAFGGTSALLVDATGQVLLADPAATDLPELATLRQQAVQSAQSGDQAVHRLLPAPEGPPSLELVAPLARGGAGDSAPAALVLRLPAQHLLQDAARPWPLPVVGARTVLLGADGQPLERLGRVDLGRAAGSGPGPSASAGLQGRAVEGVDEDGSPVLAAWVPVPGTDWTVMAAVDLESLRADQALRSLWTVGGGLVLLLALATLRLYTLERRTLANSRAVQVRQDETLRALGLLQAVAESSEDSIFAKDGQGRYLLCNRAAAQRYGRNREDVIGRDDTQLLPADEAARIQAVDAQVLGQGRVVSVEEGRSTPNGEATYLTTKGPLRDDQGRVVGLYGIARDITTRKRSEQALADSEATKRALLAAMADGLFVVRASLLVFCNPALARLLGHGGVDLTGTAWMELVAPGFQAVWREQVAPVAALSQAPAEPFTLALQHREGHAVWVEVRVSPLRDRDGAALLGLVRDVTARRQAAEELDRHRHRLQELVDERTQQLQRANADLLVSRDQADAASRAKSAFLANMSHEIRTPMNAIVGLTHLLRRDAVDTVAGERLDRIGDAAAHLMQVINDILDLSKIEAGRLQLEETDFSLRQVLARCQALVQERAVAKGLALRIEVGDAPDALRGDPTRLTQALLNLMSNAVKFTERGSVEVRVRTLNRDDAGVRLRLDVHDTGIGIAPAVLPGLFTAFVQADTSTTRRFGGTGLGLAITQRLVTMMDGEVGVQSEPGVGSCFWFAVHLRWAAFLSAGKDSHTPTPARAMMARQAEVDPQSAVTGPPGPTAMNPAPEHRAATPLGAAAEQTAAPGLPDLPGIDRELALRLVGGRVDLACRVLRQFALHYGDGPVTLQSQLAAQDLDTLKRSAHSIKGASSALGALHLPALAQTLEQAAAAVEPAEVLAPLISDLCDELRRVVQGIHAAGLVSVAIGTAAVSLTAADLDRLDALLAVADFEALSVHRAQFASLRQTDPVLAELLDQQLRAFEFERARETVQQLRRHFGDELDRRGGQAALQAGAGPARPGYDG